MFSIINRRLTSKLFWGAHVSGQYHTLDAALKAARHLFEQGDLSCDETCIPIHAPGGVAAMVFSADGALAVTSEAMGAGFRFIDIYQLNDNGSLLERSYTFDEEKSNFVEDEHFLWDFALWRKHKLVGMKPPAQENSFW